MCSHSRKSPLCFFILLTSFLTLTKCSDQLSWQHILANLNNNIIGADVADEESRTNDIERLNAYSGKLFQYTLPEMNLKDLAVSELGTSTLPKWLSFDVTNRTLHGVPTDDDIRSGIQLGVRKLSEVAGDALKSLVLNVHHNREPMKCNHGSRSKVQSSFASPNSGVLNSVSMIFASDLTKHVGSLRSQLMQKISEEFDQPITSLYMERGNRLRRDVGLENGIRFAGPGDAHDNEEGDDQGGFTVSWKIGCGPVDLKLDPHVKLLKDLSVREDFASRFLQPVLGWFVHSSEDKATQRVRRAIGGADSTPIAGTPVPASMTVSPSVSVPSPSAIQPSQSTTIVKTASPPSPTTAPKQPTTAPRVPTTVAKVPTTKQPTTVAKVPTTQPKVPTTTPPRVPTTQKPTTKLPVVVVKATTKPPQPPQPTTKKPVVVEPEITILEPLGVIQSAYENQARVVNLENLFQSSSPLTIELQYSPNDGYVWQKYSQNDWIEYKHEKLYILPKSHHVGTHKFALRGSTGSTSSKYKLDVFSVNVIEDQTAYKIAYNASLQRNFNQVSRSAKAQVRLVKEMAQRTGVTDFSGLRGVSFSRDPYNAGGVTMSWSLLTQRYLDCRDAAVDSYMEKLQTLEQSNTSPALGGGKLLKTDVVAPACEVEPVPFVPVRGEASIWQRILIPVIVIIVLLLIIVLILCCVYHRKRRTTMQIEEDKVCLNQKKPVIFLEEFEEKPHFVSLQPLMLDDEKPPTPNRPYEPRADTPEGAPRSPGDMNGGGPPPYA